MDLLIENKYSHLGYFFFSLLIMTFSKKHLFINPNKQNYLIMKNTDLEFKFINTVIRYKVVSTGSGIIKQL